MKKIKIHLYKMKDIPKHAAQQPPEVSTSSAPLSSLTERESIPLLFTADTLTIATTLTSGDS